jgi:hypothetical protein
LHTSKGRQTQPDEAGEVTTGESVAADDHHEHGALHRAVDDEPQE